MLTMHCLTDDVEKHLLPQGVEWGSFQIKFLSNSKRSAEINLHTGCKSSQTVLIKQLTDTKMQICLCQQYDLKGRF